MTPRVWAIPALALLGLVLLALAGANAPAFLAINAATRILPDSLWACITSLGDTLPAFAILLPFVARRPSVAAAALIAVLLAMLASQGLKHGLNMPRPYAVLDHASFHVIGPTLSGRSFPSGHTTAAFLVAALIGGQTMRTRFWLLLVLGASLVGLSRIAVGAHWPYDVLGGAIIGWLAGFAGLHLASRCKRCASRTTHLIALSLFGAGTLWLLTGFDSGYADARWLERGVALFSLLLFVLSILGKRNLPPSRS